MPSSNQPPGIKHDAGKPTYALALTMFRHALAAVDRVARHGAEKYGSDNFATVPDGEARYSEALLRHFIESRIGNTDPVTGLDHDAQAAWNALARLELRLRREAAIHAAASQITNLKETDQ